MNDKYDKSLTNSERIVLLSQKLYGAWFFATQITNMKSTGNIILK